MNDRYDKCSFIDNLMYFTTDSIDVHIDEQVLNVEKMKIKADLSVVQSSIIDRFKDIKNVRMENCQITDGFLETFRNIRYEKGMLIRTFSDQNLTVMSRLFLIIHIFIIASNFTLMYIESKRTEDKTFKTFEYNKETPDLIETLRLKNNCLTNKCKSAMIDSEK